MPEKSGIEVTADSDRPEPGATVAAANATSKAKFRRRVFTLASVSVSRKCYIIRVCNSTVTSGLNRAVFGDDQMVDTMDENCLI
jgi:hypothetical protein